MDRAEGRAPYDGQVMDLSVFSIGAIVSPGQTILDIVPTENSLVVPQTRVEDISNLRPGMACRSSFHILQTALNTHSSWSRHPHFGGSHYRQQDRVSLLSCRRSSRPGGIGCSPTDCALSGHAGVSHDRHRGTHRARLCARSVGCVVPLRLSPEIIGVRAYSSRWPTGEPPRRSLCEHRFEGASGPLVGGRPRAHNFQINLVWQVWPCTLDSGGHSVSRRDDDHPDVSFRPERLPENQKKDSYQDDDQSRCKRVRDDLTRMHALSMNEYPPRQASRGG